MSADAAISVTKPAPLEKIPEVLDWRVIQPRAPTSQIYVALEPQSDGGEQVRMYVACPALDIDPTLSREVRGAAADVCGCCIPTPSRRTPGGREPAYARRRR